MNREKEAVGRRERRRREGGDREQMMICGAVTFYAIIVVITLGIIGAVRVFKQTIFFSWKLVRAGRTVFDIIYLFRDHV